MSAIYRGRRYSVTSADSETVTLDSLNPAGARIRVLLDDRDLLFKPNEDDLRLAEAFERGEIEAFEHPNGHGPPPRGCRPRRRYTTPFLASVPRAATSSDVFNAVGERQRRLILDVLAGDEQSVNEIVHALGLTQPSISKHLRILREADLVRSGRDGRQIWYRANPHAIRLLYKGAGTFERFWRQQPVASENGPNRVSDRT